MQGQGVSGLGWQTRLAAAGAVLLVIWALIALTSG
jgi:hypothetical protein